MASSALASSPAAGSQRPSLSLRIKSALVMGMTGVISKCFLYGFNRVEVTGLERFLEILDSRRDPAKRQRGLLTVSNHVSVLDDPVVWGILPFRYMFDPSNLRWTLGAADICFSNKIFSSFFTQGQVLPCHRLKHSPFGGLFQPALAQAIRLLSTPSLPAHPHHPLPPPPPPPSSSSSSALTQPPPTDITYTTTGQDRHPSPLAYPLARRYSWVHVFPEGCVHQHAAADLRYFKWGLARLILEADPPPAVLPMFVDGTQHVMPEDRAFPRFLPRVGKTVRVAFGEVLDYEATFGDLKRRWDGLVARERRSAGMAVANGVAGGGKKAARWGGLGWFGSGRSADGTAGDAPAAGDGEGASAVAKLTPGELPTEELRYGKEACEIRIEVARRMRDEILKVRRSLGGYPEPEPSFGLAETWRLDDDIEAKKYRSRVDGSNISQD